MFLKIFLPLLVIFLFLKVIFVTGDRPPAAAKLKIGPTRLRVEVVQTPEQVARGLSQRPGLAKEEGMLFVFSQPGFYPFWMKEMKFPIDIVWIGVDKKVVGFSENLSPTSYPKTFTPPVPVRYVLEVNAGWLGEKQIKVGDTLVWEN